MGSRGRRQVRSRPKAGESARTPSSIQACCKPNCSPLPRHFRLDERRRSFRIHEPLAERISISRLDKSPEIPPPRWRVGSRARGHQMPELGRLLSVLAQLQRQRVDGHTVDAELGCDLRRVELPSLEARKFGPVSCRPCGRFISSPERSLMRARDQRRAQVQEIKSPFENVFVVSLLF